MSELQELIKKEPIKGNPKFLYDLAKLTAQKIKIKEWSKKDLEDFELATNKKTIKKEKKVEIL